MSDKILIGVSLFNSFQNLTNIFSEVKLVFDNYQMTPEFILIDNKSNINENKKKKIISKLSKDFNFKITLILNSENYGLGGSQKILLNFIKKTKFDYFFNLHSTGRFSTYQVLNGILKNKTYKKYDYLILSRFLDTNDTINYSLKRYCANIFFIKLTKLVSNCKFTDPGCGIYSINLNILKKLNFNNLSNNSQFNHQLNILISNLNINYHELRIKWGEGNIKSHINEIKYGLNLLKQLLTYSIFKKFDINNDNEITYKKNFFYSIYDY